jgi:hypothetical protein
LKKHGFGIKVLKIGYGMKKDNVERSWQVLIFFLVFLRPLGKQGLKIQLQANWKEFTNSRECKFLYMCSN